MYVRSYFVSPFHLRKFPQNDLDRCDLDYQPWWI